MNHSIIVQFRALLSVPVVDQTCNHDRLDIMSLLLKRLVYAIMLVPLSPTSNQKDRMNFGDGCVFDRDEFQEQFNM